ncbi:bactericidal permeability-increasing protein-like [Nothoprocta perdicaria]|uniref:bactericidal permeability-increasing protein-like n=1 Tax=Nothoprocta perdicaria TaxID=30464 RepID=UPI000E1C3733|nr:bactericidal permeability-increasing protein-like [Nothoprocta perdicaria]
MASLALLLLLLDASPVLGTATAGIKGRVTRSALDYGHRLGLHALHALLRAEHELNLTGSYRVPLLGELRFAVPRLRVQGLQLNDSSAEFAPAVGVRLSLRRAELQLHAEWAAQLWPVQDGGTVDVHAGDVAVAAVLAVGADAGGRPAVRSTDCHSSIGSLRLEFHGGQSWLYNLLAPALQGPLRLELNKHLCTELQRQVRRLQDTLDSWRVSVQLDPFAAIDYSLLQEPEITAEHGDLSIKGEFFGVGRRQQSPFSAAPVPLPVAEEPMLLVGVTEFVANSAAFVYFTAGALRWTVTGAMLPRRFPLRLSTEGLGLFAPQLQELYPERPVELVLWARRQPLLWCRPAGLRLALRGAAEASVLLPNGTRAPAFLLRIDANVTGKPVLSASRIGGSVSLLGLSVEQEESHVGPLEVKSLENLLSFGLRLFGLPLANRKLRAGFPLPVPRGLRLLQPRVTLQEGFALVTTDLQYEP